MPEKKYNKEKRACIGKVVSESENTMCPNENFEIYYPGLIQSQHGLPPQPPMSDTVKAGAYAVLKHIAKSEGLYDIAKLKVALDQLVGQRLRKNACLDAFTNSFELNIHEETVRKGTKEELYRVLESYTLHLG
ncbi:MAG: hypothetical protein J5803_03065 [Desulfovibrio sp.]|nr:hypothetical protein [Desulfovibrio sp.]